MLPVVVLANVVLYGLTDLYPTCCGVLRYMYQDQKNVS